MFVSSEIVSALQSSIGANALISIYSSNEPRRKTKGLPLKWLILEQETLLTLVSRNDSSSINLKNVIYTFHFSNMESGVSLQVNQTEYLHLTPYKKCVLITYQQLHWQLCMPYNLVFILAGRLEKNNTLLTKNLSPLK